MADPRKVHIGSFADLVSRYRAFLVPGAIELEERASFEIVRRRIPFDEVEVATLHAARRWAGPIVFGCASFFFLLVALGAFVGGDGEVGWVLAITAFALLLPGIALLGVPAHVITIFGRRTRIRVVFRFRAGKARQWFARLSREIERAQAQQRAAAANA